MEGAGGLAAGSTRAQTVWLAVHAHVVPDEAMAHAALLERDSWAHFPVRHYVHIRPSETVVTFTTQEGEENQNAKRFSD